MTQKAFIKRIPALKGESAGPPRGLFDANQIAKVWVRDGYQTADLLFKDTVEALGLVRCEAIMLSDLVRKYKIKMEGFV
jgi:hypothetical protein